MIRKLLLDTAVEQRYRRDIVASALFGVYSGIINPFMSIAALALGAKPWHIALLSAAPFLGKILSIVGGAYIGNHSKRKIFIISCIVEFIIPYDYVVPLSHSRPLHPESVFFFFSPLSVRVTSLQI